MLSGCAAFFNCLHLIFPATPEANRAVPGRAISTLPPRRGGAPTPVLPPARHSAAVRMGRGGNARPSDTERSSGVVAFWGGCYKQIYFQKSKKTPLPRRSRFRLVYILGISPVRRSAAVKMGRGGTALPPDTEWSSGVVAVLGGVVITKIFSNI